ncbi:MAG TPA: suppressor of fused domain protein [Kofleriaceae bacterium]|nr:suppressor of fused domain protein [Kofleriaceae bacterium]
MAIRERERKQRSKLYAKAHGKPAHVFEPDSPDDSAVCIEAFAFDFAQPSSAVTNRGFVLLTNGMSDRRMHLDAAAQLAADAGELKPRAELAWYVREPLSRYVRNLRWLAEFPFLDQTWLGWGHTLQMPEPILDGSPLTAFFFMTPVLARHQQLAEQLRIDSDPVELLVVHLLTTAEYEHKRAHGANAMLDLFDEHRYPLVLDERRASYV